MATIYILYSAEINQFYIGSCNDLEQRLNQHLNKLFDIAHTKRANDWTLYYSREDLEYEPARKIEPHIKKTSFNLQHFSFQIHFKTIY